MNNETTSIGRSPVEVEPVPEPVQQSQQAWRRLVELEADFMRDSLQQDNPAHLPESSSLASQDHK